MVLDFSRSEVRDYIFDQLTEVLSSANVEYVKWDMNRPLTEVFSTRELKTGSSQSETSHRYMLGVYEFMDRLVTKFPNLLLENCASGGNPYNVGCRRNYFMFAGGRFDPGMLYFSPQIWTSDNTDAIARMKIQYGTSLAYPASCVGAHVSAVPNHMTGNITCARTRALVAMSGTYG
jgi:alpha-galactosidase